MYEKQRINIPGINISLWFETVGYITRSSLLYQWLQPYKSGPGLITPSCIVRAYKKSIEQRVEALSHRGVRWTARVIRESSRRKVVGAHKEARKANGRENWKSPSAAGWHGNIRRTNLGIVVINERMLQQPLEYWGSFIVRWDDAEATGYHRLIAPLCKGKGKK